MPETCENCGDTIGRLETPRIWQDHIVCEACYAKLSSAAPSQITNDMVVPGEPDMAAFGAVQFQTETQIRVGNATIQLANIASVRSGHETQVRGDKVWAVLILAVAAISLCVALANLPDAISHSKTNFATEHETPVYVAGIIFVLCGSVGLALAIYSWKSRPPIPFITITTNAGEHHRMDFLTSTHLRKYQENLAAMLDRVGRRQVVNQLFVSRQ